jgi:metallo-beta-lactamase class B
MHTQELFQQTSCTRKNSSIFEVQSFTMHRYLPFSFCLVILLIFHSPAQGQPYPFYDSSWSKPTEPFRIAGNLYYVGTQDLACYLIVTPKGNVLINSGLADSAPLIRKSVETLGFKFSDIKILLTTQAHYDHVAALAEIKKATRAKMMVNEADAAVLADGGASDFIFGHLKSASFAPIKAERLLHHGDSILIGGTRIDVLHHPGHTKGSTSFLINVKDEKRTWRVLIANIPSILTETKLTGMPDYPNVGKDYASTFESMKKVSFDLWVASHAGQFNMHSKRKPGDGYHPEAFSSRTDFDDLLQRIEKEYQKRLKSEQSR